MRLRAILVYDVTLHMYFVSYDRIRLFIIICTHSLHILITYTFLTYCNIFRMCMIQAGEELDEDEEEMAIKHSMI